MAATIYRFNERRPVGLSKEMVQLGEKNLSLVDKKQIKNVLNTVFG